MHAAAACLILQSPASALGQGLMPQIEVQGQDCSFCNVASRTLLVNERSSNEQNKEEEAEE